MSFISALMYIFVYILCRFIVINLPNKKSSEMSDNDETKPSWESLFIEIKSTNSKTHIIVNIYRPPIDIVSSCNNFQRLLPKL